MKPLSWVGQEGNPSKILLRSALIAFLMEACFLTAVGWREHWLAHPQKTTGLDDSRFIEAEVFQVSPDAHLVEEKPLKQPKARPETVISKVPGKGAPQKPNQIPADEENKTDAGPKLSPNHGPLAIFAPQPVIPSYLRNQELNTHVVIDFLVNSQGHATPRLVSSSGNEELDALALETVKTWQFRPAEKDHKPIDSKVRLRILFEVK